MEGEVMDAEDRQLSPEPQAVLGELRLLVRLEREEGALTVEFLRK
jgi:hypothetical protein